MLNSRSSDQAATADLDKSASVTPWLSPLTMLGAGVLAYVLLASRLGNAPLQDLPNHLTRAHIIADLILNHGQVYGRDFTLQATFAPYLLGDLILAGLDHVFGMDITACIWIGASLLLMPTSMMFVARTHCMSRNASAAAGLFSLYIATDWFFCLGFMNFQLAMPLAMFAYGCFIKAKRSGSIGAYASFLIFTLLGYFMHLSALIFTIAMVGISSALSVYRKEFTVLRGALILFGPLLLLAAHFGFAHASSMHVAVGEGEELTTSWGSVGYKLHNLTATFRFGRVREISLLLVLLGVACFPIRFGALRRPRELELALIAVAFLGLYIVMPMQSGGLFSIDIRAVPYALLFLILLGLACGDLKGVEAGRQLNLSALVAAANLALLVIFLIPANAALESYKEIAGAIPRGSAVLPIDTLAPQGRYEYLPHAGSYAVAESGAIIPSLFAADENPAQSYFNYRHRPYSPPVYWYVKGNRTLDWDRVLREYRYLLVTRPWDASKIPVPFSIVRQNDVAALLYLGSAGPRANKER